MGHLLWIEQSAVPPGRRLAGSRRTRSCASSAPIRIGDGVKARLRRSQIEGALDDETRERLERFRRSR